MLSLAIEVIREVDLLAGRAQGQHDCQPSAPLHGLLNPLILVEEGMTAAAAANGRRGQEAQYQ